MNIFPPRYIDAVRALAGGIRGVGGKTDGPIEKIYYPDSFSPPSEEVIQAKLKELQAEYDANQYQRSRASSYPPIGDQLDMIYKDMKNGTTTHAEAVEEVKTKYPKG